jgi:hypothetical protein
MTNITTSSQASKLSNVWGFFLALLCFAVAAASAQTPTQPQANQEKQWKSCEGGYYTGPRQARRNYSNDKYLWVVTPEFAKRFCMPEHMVSKDLKGAEAIAFRMVDGADNDQCGVDDDGKANCSENSMARFEIYLPQSLNLPAANPEVKFYDGVYKDSEMHISGIGEKVTRSTRYRKGEYKLPEGRTNHFSNPYGYPTPGHLFGLIYAHEGKGRWPVSSLREVGFRGDWIQGTDILILEAQLGYQFAWELDHYKAEKLVPGTPDGQYLIVMDKGDSQSSGKQSWEKTIPQDHAHVIYLPHEFVQQIRQASMRRGGSWLDFVKTQQQR